MEFEYVLFDKEPFIDMIKVKINELKQKEQVISSREDAQFNQGQIYGLEFALDLIEQYTQ